MKTIDSTPAATWNIRRNGSESPLIVAAIHDGHETRSEVTAHFALTDTERPREEDPFTAVWTDDAPTRIMVPATL